MYKIQVVTSIYIEDMHACSIHAYTLIPGSYKPGRQLQADVVYIIIAYLHGTSFLKVIQEIGSYKHADVYT